MPSNSRADLYPNHEKAAGLEAAPGSLSDQGSDTLPEHTRIWVGESAQVSAMNTRRHDDYYAGLPGPGVYSAPSGRVMDDPFCNPFYMGSRAQKENDRDGQREERSMDRRYGPVVYNQPTAVKDSLTNSWFDSRNSADVPRCDPSDRIGLDTTNIETYDSMDDLYDLECTQHSFDVPRAVPALQVRHGVPPLMPEAPMTPAATREDWMCGDSLHLPCGSRERIVIHDMGTVDEGESYGGSAMMSHPPVPPLRYPRERELQDRERYHGESYGQSSMSGNSRSWQKQSFHAEYEMFDRRRDNLSKDSRNSMSFVGSLARVWSVNPNQKGSKAYHLTEVGNSEAGSALCPWENEVSDLGSVSGVMSREVSGALDSVIIDSTVLDSTDYIGSDLNVCSTFRSIAEDVETEDRFMASVRQALRNAQSERRRGSNTTMDNSRQSWGGPPPQVRSLRETHMSSENNRSLVPRMQLPPTAPRRFPLPIPCSSAAEQHKDASRLPTLVAKLGRSLSLKGRKSKSPKVPEKKNKPFRGLRKAFSKASRALSGKKTEQESQRRPTHTAHHVLEPPPRMIPLPSREPYHVSRIQSTWGSWRGNMPEPGAEDGPLTGRSLTSTFQNLTEVGRNPLHSRNMYQEPQHSHAFVSTISMEPPNFHDVYEGVENHDARDVEPDYNVYIDPYGLFERARADLVPAAIPTEVEAMEGFWVMDKSKSDSVDKMCEVLEFNHVMCKFWKTVSSIEIKVLNGRFRTIMRVPGVHEKVEEVPLNGEEIYVPRSDLANGKMNLSASLPTRGFLTFATWPNPRAGCREEHYRMEDNNQGLCIDMHFERRSGRACTVKWCFKRSK
ncbi:hypothetical protein BSKO_00221 [Bryopsis sp. KO-2023]|nr:hypothetical protein BSKO_00221 [Bryopsis sp. KO-2023]